MRTNLDDILVTLRKRGKNGTKARKSREELVAKREGKAHVHP